MSFRETPVLENDHVRLEPLGMQHHDDLVEAVRPGQIWKAWYANTPSPERMAEAIEQRLAMRAAGELVPWAVIEASTGQAVGMTTYLNLEPANRRLEIGSTWLGKETQGTRINPAMKLLLFTRAFEELGCIAVELRTHWHNRQSRAAIEKLGAKQDGVLRNHKVLENGTVRDTVVYSVLDSEWPTVRFALTERLRS